MECLAACGGEEDREFLKAQSFEPRPPRCDSQAASNPPRPPPNSKLSRVAARSLSHPLPYPSTAAHRISVPSNLSEWHTVTRSGRIAKSTARLPKSHVDPQKTTEAACEDDGAGTLALGAIADASQTFCTRASSAPLSGPEYFPLDLELHDNSEGAVQLEQTNQVCKMPVAWLK